MAREIERRGSATIGWMILASLFGPMLALGVLWTIAAAFGATSDVSPTGASPFRDSIMNLMVWVLMISGAGMLLEGVLIFILSGLRRKLFH
jgi:hypothetical protein